MDTGKKLAVLAKIGRALNAAGVTWAVGASLLLYFNGKVDVFHDIDIMTTAKDAARVKELLSGMGELLPSKANPGYKTACFMEFVIDGVEIDVMAGMVIVSRGVEYACPFGAGCVAGYAQADGVPIPLQSVADWRRYYELMGRPDKVNIIDGNG